MLRYLSFKLVELDFFFYGRQAPDFSKHFCKQEEEHRASPTPSKRYTPYNFANIALYFKNKALFIKYKAILVGL
jgi:hypothetical protein